MGAVVRRILRAVLVVGALLGAAAGWLWLHLGPPVLDVPPRGDLTIAGVTVVNPGRAPEPHRTIVVQRGRILSLADSGATERRFAGDFALPGLVDMHVHHPPATPLGDVELFALLFLAHGVTAVRDTGTMDGTIFETRRRIRAGEIAGPRVFACGPLIDGDPAFWPGSRVVHDAAEARAAVRDVAAAGADCVKVYERLTPDALAGIREEASARRLKVIGHIPDRVQFAEARLDDVQHLTGVREKGVELTAARIRAVVTTSAALHIAHTPTLVLFDHVARLSDYPVQREEPAALLLPRYYREILWNPRHDARFSALSPGRQEELREAPAGAAQVVRALHGAGVEIHVGTDTMNPFVVPGASLHEEMRLLTDAGLTPVEVWEAATRRAGEFLGVAGLGTIAPGAPADLLLFRADPTRDLAALDTLDAVVADGRLYPRAALDAALTRWRAHFDDPVFDRISMRLAGRLAEGKAR